MEDTTDGFGKDRDHNQYGEEEKDSNDEKKEKELPKPSNRGEKSAK